MRTRCFLTEPLDNHGLEWRCYMRDPDGYLIEVGQYTQMVLDRFRSHAGYTTEQLELILDFLMQATRCQQDATAKLTGNDS